MSNIETNIESTQMFYIEIPQNKAKEEEQLQKDRLNLPSNIYRYKFSQDFMSDLYEFAKIHQYDDRETFKEAWKSWILVNEEPIKSEIEMLTENKYDGDILEKMYKSARYYFRKKSTEKKEPKQRRQYISVDEELLKAMDNHIITKIVEPTYQPKTGFANFCEENYDLLKQSVQKICEKGIMDSEIIREKMKKTYKNRYFMLVQAK
jgi:hypothetical protein